MTLNAATSPTRKPTPFERARIRAVCGCDDTTIRNVFDELAGDEPKRAPSEASRVRVLNGARAIGFPLPDSLTAAAWTPAVA